MVKLASSDFNYGPISKLLHLSEFALRSLVVGSDHTKKHFLKTKNRLVVVFVDDRGDQAVF